MLVAYYILMIELGVEQDGEWSLMCPNECPGLYTCYGPEFEELYIRYEKSGKARKTVSAQKLWFSILDAQMESSHPFMCYKGKWERDGEGEKDLYSDYLTSMDRCGKYKKQPKELRCHYRFYLLCQYDAIR